MIAEGHGRPDGFDITRVRSTDAVAAPTTVTAQRSSPKLLGRAGADRPRWLEALVAAGLVDHEAVVPRHTWFGGAASALAAIYAPRDAMERGWFRCDWKFWRDTDDPAADLIALAAPANLEVASVDPDPDDDAPRIRSRVAGGRARTKTVEMNTISDVASYLNELLAEAGSAADLRESHRGRRLVRVPCAHPGRDRHADRDRLHRARRAGA
ncbi:MAG: hypothetical protein JWP01_582 [Myxococcales bacterium]|nr:hypothetical protein [Myxococcales bacterium]